MSIIKDLEVKINNGEAKLSENIYIYQNDRGIELKLKLNSVGSKNNSDVISSLFETGVAFASATILKPNGNLLGRDRTIVKNDTITFRIDKDFTDNVDEIGVYKIQFHLYDSEDNRITIPPIQFEVKELLGIVDESDFEAKYGVVDNSYTDLCTICDDGEELEIFSNGKYIKTVWSSGDLITSVKLNKIEEAIEYLDNQFHIGGEPLYKSPTIWIDVPNYQNTSDCIEFSVQDILNENLLNIDKEEHLSYSTNVPVNALLEVLNDLTNKVKDLEKEIELLKNNN